MAILAARRLRALRAPARRALLAAAGASAVWAAVAVSAGVVRLLPLWLDPDLGGWAVRPLGETLAGWALEVAFAVGAPMGWALSMGRAEERGELRIFALSGIRPAWMLLAWLPELLVVVGLQAGFSYWSGRASSEPGTMAGALSHRAAAQCATARAPRAVPVPLMRAAWLCRPREAPRLVLESPMGARPAWITASGFEPSGDLSRIELHKAKLRLAGVRARVGLLRVKGLPPFAQGSRIPAGWRAAVFSLSALGAVIALSLGRLGRRPARWFWSLGAGVSGPIATIASVRVVERSSVHLASLACVPLASILAVLLVSYGIQRISEVRAAARPLERIPHG